MSGRDCCVIWGGIWSFYFTSLEGLILQRKAYGVFVNFTEKKKEKGNQMGSIFSLVHVLYQVFLVLLFQFELIMSIFFRHKLHMNKKKSYS